MKRFFFAAVATLASAGVANAFWDVQNSGEDVFGNVNVTVSGIGDNGNFLRFECGSSSEPLLAFLIRDSSGGGIDLPAEFLHQDNAGERHQSEARLTSWNDEYVAVVVTDLEALRRIADHMIAASRPISVGIQVLGFDYRVADTYSASGSTRAGQVLIEHCFG